MKASCRFLFVFCVSCFAASFAYAQQPVQSNTTINDTTASGESDSLDTKETTTGNTVITDPAPANEVKQATEITADKHTTIEIPASFYNNETDKVISKYAEMISIEPDEVKNFPLYKFIDQWYGVRYKWGGADNSGIDCSAFSQKLYGKIYSVNLLRTAKQQRKSCELIKNYNDAVEGDLVFFRIHHIRISHVGVYLANGYFVHASRSHGVVISSLSDRYWRNRYAGCGRISKPDRAATESDYVQD